MTQPPLTHPATNPDGTCDDQNCPCHEWAKKLPEPYIAVEPQHDCGDWVNQGRCAVCDDDDTVSDCEPGQWIHEDELPSDIPQTDYDKWYAQSFVPDGIGCRIGPRYPFKTPDSPALRHTRSIVHHAEMEEERARRERSHCLECGHSDIGPDGKCKTPVPNLGEHRDTVKWRACNCKCIFPDTAQHRSDCDCPLHQMGKSERTALIDRAISETFTTFEHAWAELPESDRRVTERTVAEKLYFAGRRDREGELLETINEELRARVERVVAAKEKRER